MHNERCTPGLEGGASETDLALSGAAPDAHLAKHEGKARLPFLFRHPDGKPFAMGGVWTTGASKDGTPLDACAILTRKAEGVVRPLHDRMPLVVPPADYAGWLDPTVKAMPLLATPADLTFMARAVSTGVNSRANDDAACIEPPEAV